MTNIFQIKPAERWLALVALLFAVALNALTVYHYYPALTVFTDDYNQLVKDVYSVSGFDAWSYAVVSKWNGMEYTVYRHPLLAVFMFVPYLVNQAMSWLFGINCAIFVVAAIEVACSFYSVVFFHRVLHEVLSLSRRDASLLTAFLFSFGYMMLTVMVPEHFSMSLCFLTGLLYVAGMKMKQGSHMGLWHTVVLFFVSAGVSLNNGLNLFLSVLFTNGRRMFQRKFLLLAVFLPTVVIFAIAALETAAWEPALLEQRAQKRKMEIRHEYESVRRAYLDTARVTDPAVVEKGVKRILKHRAVEAYRRKHSGSNKGGRKPIATQGVLRWTDLGTDRWQSVVENLFGESIQLHKDHLLHDIYAYNKAKARPVIVKYESAHYYWIEAAIVALFAAGCVLARRSKFFWLVMSWFLFDMLLFLGLGFAINEAYIMTSQWAIAIPVALAFLVGHRRRWVAWATRVVVAALTLYLFVYNGALIAGFMTGSL